MKPCWRDGNRVELLENGEEYFPHVFDAIAAARERVYIETFIVFEDKVGRELSEVLCAAARRGVRIDLMVDGWGSIELSDEYLKTLREAGVHVYLYAPRRRVLGLRLNAFRRLHRKITLVDGCLAFIGGINFSADQLQDFGPRALHDYAIEVEGPIVEEIDRFTLTSRSAALPGRRWRWRRRAAPACPQPAKCAEAGPARVKFVTRDNHRHPTDIEREYRGAIRTAQKEVLIANAYFFPSYSILCDLRKAVRRGVEVKVIVQGDPDMKIVGVVARSLYQFLVPAGVHVFEFCERPMHAKVAVVDRHWATVGSSNLDPLSLSLNLEANVFVEDADFGTNLHDHLQHLIEKSCRPVDCDLVPPRTWWRAMLNGMILLFLRHFRTWFGVWPTSRPRIQQPEAQ